METENTSQKYVFINKLGNVEAFANLKDSYYSFLDRGTKNIITTCISSPEFTVMNWRRGAKNILGIVGHESIMIFLN